MAVLSFYGYLEEPVSIVNAGDAVDVSIEPIQLSQGGIIVPVSQLSAMLTQIVDTGNLWDALTLHLFTDALSPSQDTPLADFTAASPTFTGYAAQAVVWLLPQNHSTDGAAIPSQLLQFLATAVPSPENIVGYYVTHA